MTRFEPFLLERWQSENEHEVELNLSDSGVHALTLRELLGDGEELHGVLDERLLYTQTNGTPELRRAVAALHPGADETNVVATNGGAEANLAACLRLVEPGDRVVLQTPNYPQLAGLVRGLGAEVVPWPLRPDFAGDRWVADLDELAELVRPGAKLVALCNPNNPTGSRLGASELDRVCRIADAAGAWLLADEIYRGSELDERETPTAWGRGERVLVTSSLSKSYGLPGLRLGWAVAPPRLAEELWGVRDYTTIAPGALSDRVGRSALAADRRPELLARGRARLRENHARAAEWVARRDGVRHVTPRAGAMLLLRYEHGLSSTRLASRLLHEHGLLLVPGDHFGMGRWLRVGTGGDWAEIGEGLSRLGSLLDALQDEPVAAEP